MSLEIDTVEKRYASFALGPVSLSVEAEVLAVLGPSGSGKSTLLSVVAGFVDPVAGGVSLDGRDCTSLPPEARNVGVVFQDYALFPHLTVRENLAFGADEDDAVERYAALLDVTDLLDRYPETLSGGEKQRVALARALASDPDALLLDEPLASLDEPIRRRLRIDLRRLLSGLDIPVVYVTHDQEEASVIADRVAVLEDGTVAQAGTVEAVYDAPATRFVAEFVGYDNLLEGTVDDRRNGRVVVDIGPVGVPVTSTTAPVGAVTVAARPRHVSIRERSGEETGIPCTVTGTVGGRDGTTVLLSADGIDRLVASVAGDDAVALDVGDTVLARIDPEAAQLLSAERGSRV